MAISLTDRPLDIAIPIVIAVYARRFDAHDFEYHGTALYRRPNAVAFNRAKMVFAVVCRLHFCGNFAQQFFERRPRIGISAAVLGMLSCALYPYGRAPMKFLFIHDVLRLPPFPLYGVAAFIVMLDIAGVLLGWGYFAHWAHLGGFAAGGVGRLAYFSPSPAPPRGGYITLINQLNQFTGNHTHRSHSPKGGEKKGKLALKDCS